MTFDRRLGPVFALVPLLAAACGNYSNEDLEFMNALPENSELRANIPPVSGAPQLAHEAELARSTHETTRGFNGALAGLVDIVDTVRSYPPTARTPGSRIWGPFAMDATTNPGWQMRMIVSRNDTVPGQLDYEITVHRAGSADTDWSLFILGSFQTGQTARRGVGHVELRTAAVRAEGLNVGDLGQLDHLEIDYNTLGEPTTIEMHITQLPDPGSADPAPRIDYRYRANAAGQGEMTFDLIGNFIPVTPRVEDMRVVSQWLSTGEGRATLTVVSGDGMDLQQTECWDRFFEATYNDKPWAPTEDVPQDPPGDPSAICPVIPSI